MAFKVQGSRFEVRGFGSGYAGLKNILARPEPLTSATLTHMDVEQWMRVFALQHAVGNWDTYGYNRGKNAYAYKPLRGPWKLPLWDQELELGKSSDPETASLLACEDPTTLALYNHPPFGRAYGRAFHELVQAPMREAAYAPRMIDRYRALVASGVPVEHPSSLWNWINRRRNYIVSQIPSAAFTVSGTNVAQPTRKGVQLYNLSTDIGERKNVAAEHPDIVKELAAKLAEHLKSAVPFGGATAQGKKTKTK